MESKTESTGTIILRIIILIVMLYVAVRLAFFLLGLIGWILSVVITLAFWALVIWVVYYLIWGRKRRL